MTHLPSRPIDASVSVLFRPGSNTLNNSFTVYFREAVTDYITMLEMNQYSMSELNGRPLPNQGDAKWEPRELATLEGVDMEDLEGITMRELERQEDTDLLSNFRITVEWGNLNTNIYGLDSEDNGQSFLDVGDLTTYTLYAALLDVYDNAWRARIYPVTDEGVLNETGLIFDTGEVNDDFHLKRRKGTIRLVENLGDTDADVIEMRTRHLSFAEYRSKPLQSHTPVAGCQLFAEHTPGVQRFESLTRQETLLMENYAKNPTAGLNTSSWTIEGTGGEALTRRSNLPILTNLPAGITTGFRANNQSGGSPTNARWHHTDLPVKAGETWTFSAYIRIVTVATVGAASVRMAGPGLTNVVSSASYTTVGGGWARLEVTKTALVDENWEVYLHSAAAQILDFTGVMIEKKAAPASTYFDGDSPDADWLGTRHISESILFDVDVAEKDRGKSLSGESYKITNIGVTPQQSVRSNIIDFTNFDDFHIEFDLWYPQAAIDNDNPVELFLRSVSGGAFTKINLGHIQGDGWHHVKLYPVEGNARLTGLYYLIWRQTAIGQATTWWLDNINVIEESMRWEARAVVGDPWGDQKGIWTPFRDLINSEHNGIVLHERGTQLQVRGRALRQDVTLGKVKIKPKYAELGRVVFDENESHTDLAIGGVFDNGSLHSSATPTLDFGSSKKLDRVYVDFATSPTAVFFYGSNDNVTYSAIMAKAVPTAGWNTFVFTAQPTWRYLRMLKIDAGSMDFYRWIVRPALLKPTAAFTTSVSGATVTFDATTSTDADGFIVGYAWSFGDGEQGYGQKTKHTYKEAGFGYNVTLLVIDNNGNESTVTTEVGV